ncbi:hypothetical protein O4U30_24930, partial [Enterobacter hormaechei subsp. xiangfangensis]|uniref:hypothetical protein n=1 Tax=Enterobacter hormaechei TaxID=158836 RepID=UPI0028741DAC
RCICKNGSAASFFVPFLTSASFRSLVIREQVTPAAVSRLERSDRVSEDASFHHHQHFALTHRSRIFPLPHEALP